MGKMGFSTRWGLPSDHGICNWLGCSKSIVKGTCFCEEHGKIEVKVTIVDEKDRTNQERSGEDPGKNKGYHKTYP